MHYKNLLNIISYLWLFNTVLLADSYASINSKSNLRAGPGKQYPINWILTTPNTPIRILEKNLRYSKIKIYDGTTGWVWNSLISKKKTLIIIENSFLYDNKEIKIALLKKDVIVEKIKCTKYILNKASCKIKTRN